MTDRELLELAAKAAGHRFAWIGFPHIYHPNTEWTEWNPLKDDGDALRLAVKCGISMVHYNGGIYAEAQDGKIQCGYLYASFNSPEAATRRGIVRAAAEIGKEMQ